MFKNIITPYKNGVGKHSDNHVESIEKSIEKLIFNNTLLIKISYNSSKSILLNVRCNVKLIYYLDMILKLLNVVDIENDDKYYKFIINGKYRLNNNYSILTNLNVNNIILQNEIIAEDIPTIDIQRNLVTEIKADAVVSIADYGIKNKYRFDFFESWRQANYIMFKHSKNILKLNVKESNELWTSFSLNNDFQGFSQILNKNNLISLKERIPVRVVYKTAANKIILRQPIVDAQDTIWNVITNKLSINEHSKIVIQNFIIQNTQFKVAALYRNFYAPDGFLYIVVVI